VAKTTVSFGAAHLVVEVRIKQNYLIFIVCLGCNSALLLAGRQRHVGVSLSEHLSHRAPSLSLGHRLKDTDAAPSVKVLLRTEATAIC